MALRGGRRSGGRNSGGRNSGGRQRKRRGTGLGRIAIGTFQGGLGAVRIAGAAVRGGGPFGAAGLVSAGFGALDISSGARNIREGIRARKSAGGSKKGHPFYGNQFVKVSSRNKARKV